MSSAMFIVASLALFCSGALAQTYTTTEIYEVRLGVFGDFHAYFVRNLHVCFVFRGPDARMRWWANTTRLWLVRASPKLVRPTARLPAILKVISPPLFHA